MNDHSQEDVVPNPSRRRFLSLGAATGAVLAVAPQPFARLSGQTTAAAASESTIRPSVLHVQPRYHHWHVDPGVEWIETNTGYAHLDWTIPLGQAALVLVDVWDHHYLKDAEARAET